jgi:hypothetical protein
MRQAEVERFKALAAKLAAGEVFGSAAGIGAALDCKGNIAQQAVSAARREGLLAHEPRRLETLQVTAKGRKLAGLGTPDVAPAPARSVAEVAARHIEAPAHVERWTVAEMRELLDAPRTLVRAVRRALATPWGPALLETIEAMAEEIAPTPPVRVAVTSAARVARAKPQTAPVEDEPAPMRARKMAGPFRVVDAGGDVVRTCRTLSAATAALKSDDADHVLDADGNTVGRAGVDDEDDEEGSDDE